MTCQSFAGTGVAGMWRSVCDATLGSSRHSTVWASGPMTCTLGHPRSLIHSLHTPAPPSLPPTNNSAVADTVVALFHCVQTSSPISNAEAAISDFKIFKISRVSRVSRYHRDCTCNSAVAGSCTVQLCLNF